MTAGPERGAAPLERALEGLRALYADLDAELAVLRPKCELSGRCCNFPESGHELFATDLELEHLLRTTPAPRSEEGGDARLCPWWRGGHCQAREGRPLGCRVYFCDTSKAAELEELSVRFHARLKALHQQEPDVAYHYGRFVAQVRERLAPRTASGALTAERNHR